MRWHDTVRSTVRGPFFTLLRWDVVAELRRPTATVTMSVFALMLLFIGSYAVSSLTEIHDVFGPVYFWMVILLAGTVGLSRAFLVEQEHGAMAGVLVAPVEPGFLYLAKVVATWIYVMAMEVLLLAAYVVLFDFDRWEGIGPLLVVMAAFTLVYVSVGIVLAAMTTGIRGGELVLRILLFPLMIPAIIVVLMSSEGTFRPRPEGAASLPPLECAMALVAMAAIYLISGFLLFPHVVEE